MVRCSLSDEVMVIVVNAFRRTETVNYMNESEIKYVIGRYYMIFAENDCECENYHTRTSS